MTESQNDPPTPTDPHGIQSAPTTLLGILKRIGPGLILAGSIVGSGELIATTKTGAEAGFALLWLIIIGCIIKVFAQIELGRYAIISSKTTLVALNEVPAPPNITLPLGARKARGNFIVWFWLAMFLTGLAQLGGIVGGVGQAMAITWPITSQGEAYNRALDNKVKLQVAESQLVILNGGVATSANAESAARADELTKQIAKLKIEVAAFDALPEAEKPKSNDDKIWGAIITVITLRVLVSGRYGFI
ncbi:MAG: transmembrane Mn(2+) transporter, partial [Planctomycetota bacterium]